MSNFLLELAKIIKTRKDKDVKKIHDDSANEARK